LAELANETAACRKQRYNPGVPTLDTRIHTLGKAAIPSPLTQPDQAFIAEDERVLWSANTKDIATFERHASAASSLGELPSFESAGPRKQVYFDPRQVACGIVTCGGVCPGLNDVIRAITLTLHHDYRVPKILGFRYGYAGIPLSSPHTPVTLTPELVSDIHSRGGTVLGTSRGPQDVTVMLDALVHHGINVLFTIGGDGTLRGAAALTAEIERRQLPIAVIGLPKTIDNDLMWVEKSFGFLSAVEEARRAIQAANNEALSARGGIGLVKLMGRYSGFIAAHATVANNDVNFCLIPEVPFALTGKNGLLEAVEHRLRTRGHAVLVVAEGAGQDLLPKMSDTDASGNPKLQDIGAHLKHELESHLKGRRQPVTVKYIDPSYLLRGLPANAADAEMCLQLAQNAVHAGLSGRTGMLVGYWNQRFTHVPLALAVGGRKQLSEHDKLWQAVLTSTGQPHRLHD
jgi:6-phosphofructokinase 1